MQYDCYGRSHALFKSQSRALRRRPERERAPGLRGEHAHERAAADSGAVAEADGGAGLRAPEDSRRSDGGQRNFCFCVAATACCASERFL